MRASSLGMRTCQAPLAAALRFSLYLLRLGAVGSGIRESARRRSSAHGVESAVAIRIKSRRDAE